VAKRDDETVTRDLDTLTEDGPDLTAYEAPSARAAYTERPSFSPVAQPGMAPEIWYHTVPGQGQIRAYAPPANGMISRLNGRSQNVTVDVGGGGGKGKKKRKKKKGKKIGPERQWLIRKTGSQHPWTWLAQHGERIVVGPHGSRKIEKDR
jgi:hypothetical protein